MNTELKKQAKDEFEKQFLKDMNNCVFGKTMENIRKHRDIKLVTTDKRGNQLVSEPNYHTTKCFSENLLAIEMRKTKVKMNKPVYLGLSILDISKTLMYESWYDYIKPKYQNNGKLCYTDTDSFMKDELGGKIMTQFVALRPKTYSYLMDDTHVTKRAKGTKKCVIKRVLKFNDCKDCLLNNEIMLKSQQRFTSEIHNVYTEEISKIAPNSKDDK